MRTPGFRGLMRSMAIARMADSQRLSTCEAIRRWSSAAAVDRRTFLAGMGAAAVAAAVQRPLSAAPSNVRIALVGAGLAGLSCADRLAQAGIAATVYEASTRPGGRCWSLRGVFPGQVVERGGELIDNLHKTMIGYVRRFGLTLEDYEKQKGEVFYHFAGQDWPEAVVVDEYRDLVAAMQADLRALSNEPGADVHRPADVALDNMSLAEYLATRGAGPVAAKAIEAAYLAEYGLEIADQSALNFLLFIHADRRSRFMPFGVFSDERYHVVEGNDAIADGLAASLPAPVRYGHELQRVARSTDGCVELTFKVDDGSVTDRYDYVVLTLPFTVLRTLDLAESLQLPPWKRTAIAELGYGTNAKMMVGFDSPYWRALGSKGASYSDLPHHQATWETNPTRATTMRAVLTDYSSGNRGAHLDPGQLQNEAAQFVGDRDVVYPGASVHAARDADQYRAHLEHWPSNPRSRGSYTCYRPGQFTTIAGNEGKRAGNLLFAGEHANSFYEWQGFMEGACLSGLDAAAEILKDLKKRL